MAWSYLIWKIDIKQKEMTKMCAQTLSNQLSSDSIGGGGFFAHPKRDFSRESKVNSVKTNVDCNISW